MSELGAAWRANGLPRVQTTPTDRERPPTAPREARKARPDKGKRPRKSLFRGLATSG